MKGFFSSSRKVFFSNKLIKELVLFIVRNKVSLLNFWMFERFIGEHHQFSDYSQWAWRAEFWETKFPKHLVTFDFATSLPHYQHSCSTTLTKWAITSRIASNHCSVNTSVEDRSTSGGVVGSVELPGDKFN